MVEDLKSKLLLYVLSEAKSAAQWWEALSGNKRQRIGAILGINVNGRKYKELPVAVRSEIEAYWLKYNGKVE